MSDGPARTVGRYELLEVIGRGGAAVVYLANQRDLGRRVALKELAPYPAAADPTFAGRFAEESRVTGSLSHPNIVTVHEYFEHHGIPYIAMEYLSQGSLRPYVGSLTVAQIAGVLEGVLAGLAHGQARSVVHRDLKPENLLVTADGRVKIADFGVARAYADAVTRAVVTAAGTTIGTPAYMAPEQALGHGVGPAADLYSLGIVAWELLVGRVPFDEKDTPVAVLYRHVHEQVPPVRSVAPEIDPRIEAWLERMLAKDPGDRYASAETAWEELEDVVLELQGPRWRRHARLPVLETAVAGRPLTPAVFEDGAAGGRRLATAVDTPPAGAVEPPVAAADAAPPRPLDPTEEGLITPDPAPPAVSPVPGKQPAARATLHRLARRHDYEEIEAPREDKPRIGRPVAIGAILAAMAVAIVLGVLVGSQGTSRAPVRKTTPTISAATQASELVSILKRVASARHSGIKRLDAAPTAAAEASAAAAVGRAYATGVKQVAALPAVTKNSSRARAIDATLKQLDALYGSLSAEARARSTSRYASMSTQITAAERRLRTETNALR